VSDLVEREPGIERQQLMLSVCYVAGLLGLYFSSGTGQSLLTMAVLWGTARSRRDLGGSLAAEDANTASALGTSLKWLNGFLYAAFLVYGLKPLLTVMNDLSPAWLDFALVVVFSVGLSVGLLRSTWRTIGDRWGYLRDGIVEDAADLRGGMSHG
jgi:hypothetical protein